ncbi:hypothetical protein CBR_g26430 [Chara braunii]|uniref:Reverse transcriptase RNase H-like domain-containing protein n=1 Tax=Chara braunii TaxID=69332 RepID=A0A388L839_CHABU|nr:hypothetical protein CBR_g26430 [Chara braunii]|eukprot:GBG78402.1 hypothetical protein CBR_g26430 [Chara braunii]
MSDNNDNQDERRNDIRELARIIQQSQKDQISKVDVPLFDGNNASGWAEKFEQLESCCEWSNEKMLRMVKRYCKNQYKEEVEELVQDSRDWPEFKRKLLEKYQLSDQLLDLTDLRKVSWKNFGATKQNLTEFERVASPFIIETDSGPTALGGVLVQKDGEGRERPLRFESETLNITEWNYSQFKKETLAVLHCLRIFRNSVFDRRFILRVDLTALAQSLKNYSPSDPTIARWLAYIWMFNFEIERISGTQNRADGLSRVDWDSSTDQAEDSVSVDGSLEREESQLSINSYNNLADATTRHGKTIWNAPCFHHVRSELVIGEPFIEEDPWGERTSEQMMNLALSDEVELIKEPLTIQYGYEQADKTFMVTEEMSFLVNSLIHEDRMKMMNGEAEGSEIKEAFREGEYDEEYRLMRMWLNGELREDEVDPVVRQKSKDFIVRYGHFFKKSNDGIPKRVVCGVARQLDVIAALHDGVADGHGSA